MDTTLTAAPSERNAGKRFQFELRCAMFCRLTPLLLLLLGGCVTTRDEQGDHALEYGCGDLVVIGRVTTSTIAEHPNADPNDPLSGWLSEYGLQVHIKSVIRGSEKRATVPAIRIAHAQIGVIGIF